MQKEYARYPVVRSHQALWKGDPAKQGSQFRQIVIASENFNSTAGMFQVYSLDATGKGLPNGSFGIAKDELNLIFDGDFKGIDAAGAKFRELRDEAMESGFKPVKLTDEMKFQRGVRGEAFKKYLLLRSPRSASWYGARRRQFLSMSS